MRLLVLGGTRFLSREIATRAVARGWEVTCACRGESGTVPDGATHLRWDRADDAPDELRDGGWDAVVDVARLPSHVRRAVEAVPDAHWVFVSTVNVYADNTSPAMEPLVEPVTEDVDLATDPEAYGAMKVACESIVREGAASSMVVRPGLIAGPGDGTGRFGYWPARLARGGEVLAPGTPDDVVQVIDVRDLAEWVLDACEARTTGVYDAVGTPDGPRRPARRGRGRRGRTRTAAHLGRRVVPRGAGRRALGRRRVGAAVAAATRLRRDDVARPRAGRRGRAAAPAGRRHRPRQPRR